MATSVVQSTFNGTSAAVSTVTCAFSSNVTTGNTIVVIFSASVNSAISVSSVAISPGSGSFSQIVEQTTTPNVELEAWGAANVTGGTTPTVTVTMSRALQSGNAEGAAIGIYEISGMPTSLTTDGTASGNNGTSTSGGLCTTNAITTSNANDILFSAFVPGSHMTAGEAGWTFLSDSGNFTGFGSQYIIVSSTQSSLQATGTCASGPQSFGGIIFALEGTGGGSTIDVTVSGSLLVTGSITTAVLFQTIIAGTALVTGSVTPIIQTSLNPTVSGSILVTGSVSPNVSPIKETVSGSILVTGSVTPIIQGGSSVVGSSNVNPLVQYWPYL